MNKLTERVKRAASFEKSSSWDRHFLDSISAQLDSDKKLTEKQLNILRKLEDQISDYDIWRKSWTEAHKEKFDILNFYYAHQDVFYFSSIFGEYTRNGILPTRREYDKITTSKYALRIFEELDKMPKYNTDDLVVIRKGAFCNSTNKGVSWRQWEIYKEYPLFIIDTYNHKVYSSSVGCRVYKVLASKDLKTFEVEQRQIKRYKKTNLENLT